jgi:hypothetical protein
LHYHREHFNANAIGFTLVRVLNTRGVGFVTYTNEANSQFAKEAMAHQSLDHNEILNVRWATVDPNPMAQAREARKVEEQAAEAIRRALPADYVAEIEGRDPEARKRKRIEGGFGLDGYEAPDEVYFAREASAIEPGYEQKLPKDASTEERMMTEAGDNAARQETRSATQQGGGGILSGATLAALQGYTQQTGGAFSSRLHPAKPSGPLVAYGSDSDSD